MLPQPLSLPGGPKGRGYASRWAEDAAGVAWRGRSPEQLPSPMGALEEWVQVVDEGHCRARAYSDDPYYVVCAQQGTIPHGERSVDDWVCLDECEKHHIIGTAPCLDDEAGLRPEAQNEGYRQPYVLEEEWELVERWWQVEVEEKEEG